MNKTEAARILARHVLTEATERHGAKAQITDEFARDVIAEAKLLAGTWHDVVAQAAMANPAVSRVKAEAKRIIARANRKEA